MRGPGANVYGSDGQMDYSSFPGLAYVKSHPCADDLHAAEILSCPGVPWQGALVGPGRRCARRHIKEISLDFAPSPRRGAQTFGSIRVKVALLLGVVHNFFYT